MIINNKLDQSFGPVGSFAGIVVFVAGLGAVYYSLYAVILALIGAFVCFSYSCTLIDLDKKRIRFSNNLFGVIKTDQWITVKPDMKRAMNDNLTHGEMIIGEFHLAIKKQIINR